MGSRRYRDRRRREEAYEGGLIDACFSLSKRYPLVGLFFFVIFSFIAAGISASKPRLFYGASSLIAFIVFLLGLACLVAAIIGVGSKMAADMRRLETAGWKSPGKWTRFRRWKRDHPTIAPPPAPSYPMHAMSPAGASMVPPNRNVPLPYQRNDQLLTPGENAFWQPLCLAVKDKYDVLFKVRLADVVKVPGWRKDESAWFEKIKGYHVDFVICELNSSRALLIIELDDASHQGAQQASRDEFKDKVLADAGMPLYRQRCQQAYDPLEIARNIQRLIARGWEN